MDRVAGKQIVITATSALKFIQVLEARADVDGVFLLFPTISNILGTPNGRRLSVRLAQVLIKQKKS